MHNRKIIPTTVHTERGLELQRLLDSSDKQEESSSHCDPLPLSVCTVLYYFSAV